MKIRAILTIKGDVQEAGYRVIIQKAALKMGFTGYAENLKNGDVKVVCECEENELDKFIEAITVGNAFVSVENIEKKVEKATGEYESFEVKVGDLAFEMFQGYATAGKYFNWLGQKVDGVGQKVEAVGKKVENSIDATKEVGQKVDVVGQKVDVVGQKVDVVGQKVDVVGQKVEAVGKKVENSIDATKEVGQKVDGVGQKVDILTAHTDEHFNKLDEKYGIVSETLISMNKEQARTREELTRAVDSLNSLVNSVNILIKEHIEKEK